MGKSGNRTGRRMAALLWSCCCCAPAFAQVDPGALQQQAIHRIDGFIEAFRKTGNVGSLMGELAQADRELAQSNEQFAARHAWGPLALGLTKQGSVQRLQGRWDAAVASYERAVAAAQSAGNVSYEADALAWGALAEASRGNLGAALTDATRAVRLAQTTSDPDLLGRALDVLGNAQVAQRDLAGAGVTTDREVAVARQARDPMTAYYAYANREDVYLKLAEKCDYQRSFAPCHQALALARADVHEMQSIAQRLNYAALAQKAAAFMSDLERREQLVNAQERSFQTLQQSRVFKASKPADVLVTQQFVPPPGAVSPVLSEMYQAAKRMEQKYPGFSDSMAARNEYLEGLMNEMQGNNPAALEHYLKSVDRLERDRRTLHDEGSRGTLLEDRINFYYAPLLQELQRGRYPEAFALLERSRSRAMADTLASRTPGLSRPREQQLYAEVAALRARTGASQSELFELLAAPETGTHQARITALQAEVSAFEVEDRRLLGRIASEAPRLRDLVVSQPVSLATVQQSMRDEHYEMLEYLLLESGILVWHISADSIYVCNVFLPRSEVLKKVGALRASLEDRNSTFDQGTARELFLYLIQPVLSRIHAEHLVIVPHEDLGAIPFQTLQDPSSGRYFGESVRISYAPSATVLLALQRAPGVAGARLLAVADPDIGAAGPEVRAIAALSPGRSKTVTSELARESDVKAWVGDAEIIHLSVHGKFEPSDPMLSYLQLARGGGDDGKLTAAEMFGLPLDRSRLVVLSACETGRAVITHSNEVNGMVRALLYAGAPRLVLSNWQVDSAASALWMQTFYRTAQAQPLPEAARAALLTVKNTPGFSHPYFWAAFMLVGR